MRERKKENNFLYLILYGLFEVVVSHCSLKLKLIIDLRESSKENYYWAHF